LEGCNEAGANVGTCDPTSGDLTCTACTNTKDNYDCLNDKTAPCTAAINPSCDLTGTYACDGSTCVCKEEYYTDAASTDCSQKRLRAVCGTPTAGIDFFFAPYSTFTGRVFFINADTSDNTEHTDCLMTETTGGSNIWTFHYDDYDAAQSADCPLPYAYPADAGAADAIDQIAHTRWKVRVQYTTNVYSTADLEVTFKCAAQDGSEAELDVQILSTTVQTGEAIAVSEDIDSGLSMRVVQGATDPVVVGTSIIVGTPLDIIVQMPVATGSSFVRDDFSIKELWILNYPASAFQLDPATVTGAVAVQLIDNICVLRTPYVTALDKYDTSDTTLFIKVTITAFRIEGQATDYTESDDAAWVVGSVWVYAVICLGTCARTGGITNCDPDAHIIATGYDDMIEVVGPNAGDEGARRRRDVNGPEEGTNINLNLSFVVADPRAPAGILPHHLPTGSSDCYQSAAFLLPLILMGVVLVLSVISTFYFFSKVTRSKRGLEEGHTNMAYK